MSYIGNQLLYNFLIDTKIDYLSAVEVNELEDEEYKFQSYYVPHYFVSALANKILQDIKRGQFTVRSTPEPENVLLKEVQRVKLKTQSPRMYALVQVIVLEAFSLTYSLDNNNVRIQYITPDDIRRVRDNINYLADYFGTIDDYDNMVEPLRDLDIGFGYIQKRLENRNRWTQIG